MNTTIDDVGALSPRQMLAALVKLHVRVGQLERDLAAIQRPPVEPVPDPLAKPTVCPLADRTALAERTFTAVAWYMGVPRNAIVGGKARTKRIALARHVAEYLLAEDYGLSTPQIGHLLRRDHSSVLWGMAKIRSRLSEQAIRTALQNIRRQRDLLQPSQ